MRTISRIRSERPGSAARLLLIATAAAADRVEQRLRILAEQREQAELLVTRGRAVPHLPRQRRVDGHVPRAARRRSAPPRARRPGRSAAGGEPKWPATSAFSSSTTSGTARQRGRGRAPASRESGRSATPAAASRLRRGSGRARPAPRRCGLRPRSPSGGRRAPRRGRRQPCCAAAATRGGVGVTGSSPMNSSTRSEASRRVRVHARVEAEARQRRRRRLAETRWSVSASGYTAHAIEIGARAGSFERGGERDCRRRPGSRGRLAGRSPRARRRRDRGPRAAQRPRRIVHEHAGGAELGQRALPVRR